MTRKKKTKKKTTRTYYEGKKKKIIAERPEDFDDWDSFKEDEESGPAPEYYEEFKVAENAALKKYPCPVRGDELFKSKWDQFLPDIFARENFKVGHLSQLRVLCDLFVEYDYLMRRLRLVGYTYDAGNGRNGHQIKRRPEVEMAQKTRVEIRSYMKHLGLVLFKDTDLTDEEKSEAQEEW